MRQFKFRAWHKELKIMKDFTFDDLVINGLILFTKDISIPVSSVRIEKMQYLGGDCKDCEGVELCEEDIIKDEDGEKYIIKYDTESGCFYPDGYEYEMPFDYSECKIIGNTYKNPELLNVSQT